jgi:hypothetical protein
MRTRQLDFTAIVVAVVVVAAAPVARAGDNQRLVVHEWGTFTCLQDEHGREVAGINIDDEPVPRFVHNLAPYIQNRAVLSDDHWTYRQKGAPSFHPLVTMRLETPVIYFYPPANQVTPFLLNVDVQFRGGWLTEFYPKAKADAPGLIGGNFRFRNLTPQTIGSLGWHDLKVGTTGAGPQTTDNVWLAPRKVNAVSVSTASGESEKYLFYRGVGQLRAPLRVSGDTSSTLTVHANFDEVLAPQKSVPIKHLWLVDIAEDGGTAYRALDPVTVNSDTRAVVATTHAHFSPGEYARSADDRGLLKQSMHKALVAEGLYDDEATAMLATWNRAYFESPGLRLFFVVPREWVDYYLPLSISKPADVNRVMIARVELVSPRQRELLRQLAGSTPSDGKWISQIKDSPAQERFMAGRSDFGDLGVPIPADYQLYLQLGRFRNALVVSEERVRPHANLTRFVNTYGLHPFRITDTRTGGSTRTGTSGGNR